MLPHFHISLRQNNNSSCSMYSHKKAQGMEMKTRLHKGSVFLSHACPTDIEYTVAHE